MTASSSILDFSAEDTADFTGILLMESVLASSQAKTPFEPRVPPHLRPDAIGHWDYDPLKKD